MLRRDLAPLDTYLADAMSMDEEAFIDRYPWPVLVTPAPSADLLRKLRRPETKIEAYEPHDEVDPMAPAMVGASLDALCLLLRPLEPARTTMKIGRAPGADVVLIDESVSRLHAELTWHRVGGRAVLSDLETKNGTFVEDRRLGPNEEADVMSGCILRFGSVITRFYVPQTFRVWLVTGAPRSGASPGKWPGTE